MLLRPLLVLVLACAVAHTAAAAPVCLSQLCVAKAHNYFRGTRCGAPHHLKQVPCDILVRSFATDEIIRVPRTYSEYCHSAAVLLQDEAGKSCVATVARAEIAVDLTSHLENAGLIAPSSGSAARHYSYVKPNAPSGYVRTLYKYQYSDAAAQGLKRVLLAMWNDEFAPLETGGFIGSKSLPDAAEQRWHAMANEEITRTLGAIFPRRGFAEFTYLTRVRAQEEFISRSAIARADTVRYLQIMAQYFDLSNRNYRDYFDAELRRDFDEDKPRGDFDYDMEKQAYEADD